MAARRVLVIEDDAGSRDALGSLLAEDGYLVRTAPSGARGLECAGEFRPDTVICDYHLPDMDGLSVLRHLRRQGTAVFFIALTAGCGSGDDERALREEAALFHGKPVDLIRLRALLGGGAPEADDLIAAGPALN